MGYVATGKEQAPGPPPKTPPHKGPAPPSASAGPGAADGAAATRLGKYRFFYILLAMALIAYIGMSEYKDEKVRAPQPARTPAEPRYARPPVADNGAAWPNVSGHIQGYRSTNTDGGSQVAVENGNANSDMLVKLFSLDEPGGKAVRVFFVRAGDRYTVRNVRPGRYDVRYKNLGTGDRFRSEPFTLEDTPDGEGVRHGAAHVYLYKGNQKTQRIGEDDFADDLH